MPTARFLHDMGIASIVAGFVLLGIAQVVKRKARIKRAVRRGQ